jgi:hypothetical protein
LLLFVGTVGQGGRHVRPVEWLDASQWALIEQRFEQVGPNAVDIEMGHRAADGVAEQGRPPRAVSPADVNRTRETCAGGVGIKAGNPVAALGLTSGLLRRNQVLQQGSVSVVVGFPTLTR